MPLSAYEKAQFELIIAGLAFDDADSASSQEQEIYQSSSRRPQMSVRTGDILTIILAFAGMFLVATAGFLMITGNVTGAVASLLLSGSLVWTAHIIETRTKKNQKFQ